MTIIEEGNHQFEFGNSWSVLKYDKFGSYYKSEMEHYMKPTKAVDIICARIISNDCPLILIEIKDFSSGDPNKRRYKDIPLDVALKVRDTIAGIIGGSYHAENNEKAFFKNSYNKMNCPPRIIYFFKDLDTTNRRPKTRQQGKQRDLEGRLKKFLNWLTKDVYVLGENNYDFIDDLKIRRK